MFYHGLQRNGPPPRGAVTARDHGVGNVLTSVVTNFEVTLRTLNDSRVDRVKKVATML